MAVTMSETAVNRDSEIKLQNTTINNSITEGGAYIATDSSRGDFGVTNGVILAGITPTFAVNVNRAIEEYCTKIENKINEIETIDSTGAFKGENVTNAISNFINGVKEVANAYIESLKSAEQEIINSVQTAYSKQDESISGNLNTDSNTLTSEMPHL